MSLVQGKLAHKTAHATYTIRVCIKYKHIRDTTKACNSVKQPWGPYVNGHTEPHFPTPSTLGETFMGSRIVAITHAHVTLFEGTAAEWLKEDV